jgi:hypothetical protein
MTPGIRKLSFTAHVTSSVGWLGAVAAFLPLSLAALTSADTLIVRSAFIAMNLVGLYVLVPLSITAYVTGIVQSLGTRWGLFKHYWVIAKLALTSGAMLLLLVHQFMAIRVAAQRAAETAASAMPAVGELGSKLARDATLGFVVLLAITVLGIYKPWGTTSYGSRKLPAQRAASASADPQAEATERSWAVTLLIAIVAALFLVFAALHISHMIEGHHH